MKLNSQRKELANFMVHNNLSYIIELDNGESVYIVPEAFYKSRDTCA